MNYNKFNFKLSLKIALTKKQFLLYNLDKTGKVTDYKFTNNLLDKRNLKFSNFYVISCIRKEVTDNLI